MHTSRRISKGLENLIYLFVLIYAPADPEVLFDNWHKNKILRVYNRPDIGTLKLWFLDIKEELEEMGIKILN